MAKYIFKKSAETDLEKIWHYTTKKWGLAQAIKYTNALETAFTMLADNPLICRKHFEFEPPIRIHHHASHLIIYLMTKNQDIIIIRSRFITDEIKFIEQMMSSAESMYVGWEKWFLTLNIALFSAIKLLFDENSDDYVVILFPLIGVMFAFIFDNIQKGNHNYATIRLEYRANLERLMHDKCEGVLGYKPMQITTRQYNVKKEKKIEASDTISKKEIVLENTRFSTWKARKYYPMVFAILWIMVFLQGIYNLCK